MALKLPPPFQNYEALTDSSEAMLQITMIHLLGPPISVIWGFLKHALRGQESPCLLHDVTHVGVVLLPPYALNTNNRLQL